MKIDINAIVATVKPWDLSLTIGDTTYPVRRLSSADFKRLSDAPRYDNDANLTFLRDLFEGDAKPDIAVLDAEQGSAVMSVLVAYYQEAVLSKNFEAAGRAVKAQLPK